jgi:NAD(P)-dependent dehydrogenase (short-subunit alcohol dehydrogenase family)
MDNQDSFSLHGKHIVITGASSGIGRACAVLFAARGAGLSLLGRDQDRLQETLALTGQPHNHTCFNVDLTDHEKVAETVRNIVDGRGPVAGIVNCAGISTTLPVNAMSEEKMEYFLRTNVVGPVNLTRHFLKQSNFSDKGGSVVFISSVMGIAGEKGKTLYSMTKGALVSTVRSMAIELAERRIRVNAVSPGVVDSPMSKSAVYSRNEEALNKIRALHPLGLGEPVDVANTCLFLISDASKWITGTNIIVDGGYLAR